MQRAHLIDCHILTLPRFDARWVEELRKDLDIELAKPWANTNRSTWPVHVPVVGRLWRQHGQNGCRGFQPGDFELMARVLGFPSVNDLRDTVTRVCLNQPKPKPHQEVQHA